MLQHGVMCIKSPAQEPTYSSCSPEPDDLGESEK